MRVIVALCAAMAGSVAVSSARASPVLRLSWRAPPECPPLARIEQSVAGLLSGAVTRQGDAAELVARAVVARERGGRWRVRIHTELAGTVGERTLEGDSCSAVASATALILAMTLDPDAVRGTAAPAPVKSAPAPAASLASAAEVAPPASVDFVVSRSAWRLGFRPVMVAALGALPGLAPGLGGQLEVRSSALVLVAHAQVHPSQRARLVDTGDAGGRFSMVAAGVRTCRPLLRASPGLDACLGLELQRVDARGFGVAEPGAGTGLWLAPLLGLGVPWSLTPRIALHLAAEATAPLSRPRFVLLGLGPVWRPVPVGGRATLGVTVSY